MSSILSLIGREKELFVAEVSNNSTALAELEHPTQFCNKLALDGSMDGFIYPKNIQRTQDPEPYYRLNGAIHLFNREYVNKLDKIYNDGTYSYIMESKLSIDIDTENDFELAEYYMCK